jgi:uncharacterized membrane-anchored protein
MNTKNKVLIVFILVSLVQLFIPAKMIFDREDVLATGKEFKFRTQPIDPNDPFRGKFVSLQFSENSILIQNQIDWLNNETVFVLLTINNDGFAKIKSVSKIKPLETVDFVKAKVDYIQNSDSTRLFIEYPFTRFYMEESKAPMAELVYNETVVDTNIVTYGLVSIKDGEAVLKDVLINETSIVEIVKARNDIHK